jgi:hypothetical protein
MKRVIQSVNDFRLNDVVDVPFVNGTVRCKIKSFTDTIGNDILVTFYDGTTSRVDELSKVEEEESKRYKSVVKG